MRVYTLLACIALCTAVERDVFFVDPSKVEEKGPFGSQDQVLREILDYDPVAKKESQIMSPCGKARFTVLTERMIRMEHSLEGKFEDRATLAFVHRSLALPPFSWHISDNQASLVIETKFVRVVYQIGSSFSSSSLNATLLQNGNSWTFGSPSTAMDGTIRSLDQIHTLSLNCSGPAATKKVHEEGLHCTQGVISRQGILSIEDSDTPILSPEDGWWSTERHANASDVYLFAHGQDYKAALREFIQVSGRPAIPPRAALGVWWTRWFDFTQDDVEDIVQQHVEKTLPLDLVVLDMNFHRKNGWTGYSFDPNLYPFPEDMFSTLKNKYNLTFMANMHDADGVATFEDQYTAFADLVGWKDRRQKIPFKSCVDRAFAFGLEDTVVDGLRLNGKGFDHFWIDWQQGEYGGGCAGGKQNPTFWLNRLRCLRATRKGLNIRDMVLSRFGGLGSHRYPVGFSADVSNPDWEVLRYLPYFTTMSSNLAYGMWSHDLASNPDQELFVRWVQLGAFSPVMRFHDRGESAGNCNQVFEKNDEGASTCLISYPSTGPSKIEYFAAVREVSRLRLQMLPMWYNLQWEFHHTGLSPLRPMYFEFPDLEESYTACTMDGMMAQFMVGDDLLFAPVVTSARDKVNQALTKLVKKNVFIPPGTWIERFSGNRLHGPTTVSMEYDLAELGLFVRAGAVVPMLPLEEIQTKGPIQGLAGKPSYSDVDFEVHLDPSVPSGSGFVYMDDGRTLDYLSNKNSGATTLSYSYSASTVTGSGSVCGELELKLERHETARDTLIRVRLMNVQPFKEASTFDSASLSAFVEFGAEQDSITLPTVCTVVSPLVGRVRSCNTAKRVLDDVRSTPSSMQLGPGDLLRCAAFPVHLKKAAVSSGFDQARLAALVDAFSKQGYMKAFQELDKVDAKYSARVAFGKQAMSRFLQ